MNGKSLIEGMFWLAVGFYLFLTAFACWVAFQCGSHGHWMLAGMALVISPLPLLGARDMLRLR